MKTLREVTQILERASAKQIAYDLGIQDPVSLKSILTFEFIDAEKLRKNIVAATQNYKATFGVSPNYLGLNLNESQINSFFTPPAPWNTDCWGAANIIMARGLILSLNPGEFDKLGYTSGYWDSTRNVPIPTTHLEFRFIATSDQMLIGEWAYFQNDPQVPGKYYLDKHPGGPYQGENVIKVSDTAYYGFPGGTKTEQAWNQELINAYNSGLPRSEQISTVPGFQGSANLTFDLRAINLEVWKLRHLIWI